MNIRYAFHIASLAGTVFAMATLDSSAGSAPPVTVDQGKDWTETAQKEFYSHDQGSRIIPLRWIAALKQPNGEPFMAASLSRYGYLPNEASTPPGLPVGFTVASEKGTEALGMTCSACHTRQIEVRGVSYRIDGGPAIVDIQSFFADLGTAVNRVLTDGLAFTDFARAVLGPSPPSDKEAALREAVQTWFTPYHTLVDRALPKDKPWGPARLDAVAMILNRLTGLDIGPPPTYLIPENIKPADAPVRYPFLWNASIQDKTQWPGFADHGDKILALSRNLGEVYGTFAVVHPKKDAADRLPERQFGKFSRAGFAGRSDPEARPAEMALGGGPSTRQRGQRDLYAKVRRLPRNEARATPAREPEHLGHTDSGCRHGFEGIQHSGGDR